VASSFGDRDELKARVEKLIANGRIEVDRWRGKRAGRIWKITIVK
jgi:hypothetical protein